MRLFALGGSKPFGERVASFLDRSLDPLEERDFEDGEHKVRPLVSVRDEDVYVVFSLHGDGKHSVNDKLCRLLFLIAALKDNGARRVTAVVPYLCYARKDRRTKARDPVTMRYVASLFESVCTDRLVAIDVHNLQAFQNAFRIPTEHLEARNLFVSYFQAKFRDGDGVLVMSPDIGGVKRAEQFRSKLASSLGREVAFAFMEKVRSEGIVSGETVVGNVSGKIVILLDDLVNSGSTMARAAAACMNLGAKSVHAVATHGAFIAGTNKAFSDRGLSSIVVTNTVSALDVLNTAVRDKLVTVDVAPLFAEAIRRLSTGGSMVTLMEAE